MTKPRNDDKVSTMRAIATVALMLLCGTAAAQTEQSSTPVNNQRPEQYARTSGPKKMWGIGSTSAGATKTIKTQSGSSTPQLFKWGAQVKIGCNDRVITDSSRSGALVCWVQDGSPTIYMGGAVHDAGSGAGTNYMCDDTGTYACGYTVDAAGPDGQAACEFIPSGSKDYLLVEQSIFHDVSRPGITMRHGRCEGATSTPKVFNGHPCDADGDCGGSATCNTAKIPDGAYLAITHTSTTVSCQVTEAL